MKMFFCKQQIVASLFILLWSLSGFAGTQNFSSASYKEAKQAQSFIRFDMASTKLGLITTSFDGYIKRFTLQGTLEQEKLVADASIEFAVAELDTDTNARNEKMWNHCLDMKNHPTIRIVLKKELLLGKENEVIPATMMLRGTEKPISLSARAKNTPQGVEFDFTGDFSIKELGIPDPSILVATVRDSIKVTGHFIVPQK
jgi:polyisoprenoid-binding protein YceI